MTTDFFTVKLGRGVGPVIFGQTREEVRRIVGEPDDILPDEDGMGSEIWVYHDASLALSFNAEEEYRLSSFETRHPWAAVSGYRFIQSAREEVVKALTKLGRVVCGIGHTTEDRLEVPEIGLTVYLENERVTSLQCGVLVNQLDRVEWPGGA